jgi:lysozyme
MCDVENMQISEDMIAIIKKFEGLRLKAYKCPAGVYTIGYGHTENVFADSEISELMADQILRKDLKKFEQTINNLDLPLLQCEFDALVSFAFNVGIGNFNKSTLKKLLLQKKFFYAAKEFDKWVFAGGKKLPGLQNRRTKERKIFEGRKLEDYQDSELNSLIESISDDLNHSKSEIKKSEYQKNIAYLIENKILKSRITELLEIINGANL